MLSGKRPAKKMIIQEKRPSVIIGACGEHYLASYLSGFGLIVAMPRAVIPGCDLLVATSKGGRAARLQVKTGTQSTKTHREEGKIYLCWTSQTVIKREDPNLWYAYIWLKNWPHGEQLPEVFFVPAHVVVKCLKQCVRDKEWPCFWMHADDAKKFEGQSGLRRLMMRLR
jgi:hypothetical protein